MPAPRPVASATVLRFSHTLRDGDRVEGVVWGFSVLRRRSTALGEGSFDSPPQRAGSLMGMTAPFPALPGVSPGRRI